MSLLCSNCHKDLDVHGEIDESRNTVICTHCAVSHARGPEAHERVFANRNDVWVDRNNEPDVQFVRRRMRTRQRDGGSVILGHMRRIIASIPSLSGPTAYDAMKAGLLAQSTHILRCLIQTREIEARVMGMENDPIQPDNYTSAHGVAPSWAENLAENTGVQTAAARRADTDAERRMEAERDFPLPVPERVYKFGRTLAFPKDVMIVAFACVLFAIRTHGKNIGLLEKHLVMSSLDQKKQTRVHQFTKKIQVRISAFRGKDGALMAHYKNTMRSLCASFSCPWAVQRVADRLCGEFITGVYLGGKNPLNAVFAALVLACEDCDFEFTQEHAQRASGILGIRVKGGVEASCVAECRRQRQR